MSRVSRIFHRYIQSTQFRYHKCKIGTYKSEGSKVQVFQCQTGELNKGALRQAILSCLERFTPYRVMTGPGTKQHLQVPSATQQQ